MISYQQPPKPDLASSYCSKIDNKFFKKAQLSADLIKLNLYQLPPYKLPPKVPPDKYTNKQQPKPKKMSSLLPTTNISLYTIPIAWILALLPHVYATKLYESKTKKQFDLTQPRSLIRKLETDQTLDQATKGTEKNPPSTSHPHTLLHKTTPFPIT